MASYRLTEPGGVPPVIAILTPSNQQNIKKPELTVSVKIIDDTGINDVALELNGVEIEGGDSGIRDLKIRPTGDKRELDLSWNISLKRGLNKITVVAYDTENLVAKKSVDINFTEERG